MQPIYYCLCRHMPGSVLSSAPVGTVVVSGRLVAAAVESWVLQRYLGDMLHTDAVGLQKDKPSLTPKLM